jgi:hypothetical protein
MQIQFTSLKFKFKLYASFTSSVYKLDLQVRAPTRPRIY